MTHNIELKEGDEVYAACVPSYGTASGTIEGPFKLGAPDKRTGNFRVTLSSGVRQFNANGRARGGLSYSSSTTLYRADDPRLHCIRHEVRYARQVARLRELVAPRTHHDNPFPRPPELCDLAPMASELAVLCDMIEALKRRLAELQAQKPKGSGA